MSDIFTTAVIAGVVAIASALLTWLTARRTANAGEITAKAGAEEKASDAWKGLYTELKKDLEGFKSDLAAMTIKHEALETLVEEQEKRETITRKDLDAVFAWIEGGMAPPPPERPIYLTQNTKRR